MKRTLPFLMLIFLAGCFSVPVASPSYTISKNNIPANTTQKKEIGEAILEFEKGQTKRAIILNHDAYPKQSNTKIFIPKGEVLLFHTITGDLEHYFPINSISKNGVAVAPYGIAINTKNGKEFIKINYNGIWTLTPVTEPLDYITDSRPDVTHDYFKQQFIYNGKSGSTVKFTYREFANDYARPAFAQELQYDLTESKTIGFKGARLDIINASNSEIEYTITTGFKED